MEINCPKELNKFLIKEPLFENTFPEEECEMHKFYGDCFHCFGSAIAKRDQNLLNGKTLKPEKIARLYFQKLESKLLNCCDPRIRIETEIPIKKVLDIIDGILNEGEIEE